MLFSHKNIMRIFNNIEVSNSLLFRNRLNSRQNFIFTAIILSLMISGFSACNFQKEEEKQISEEKENYLPYELKNPDRIYHLPEYLDEISGISCYKKNRMVCVQDEKAIVYFYDTKNGEVKSKFDFGNDNDYEDIAVVGDDAYVLRSDGTLFQIKSFETNQKKTIKINTSLNAKNNTEGLVLDKESNSFLIVCKDSPSIYEEEIYKGFKAIYRFDLKNNILMEKPEYLIDISKVEIRSPKGSIEKYFIKTAQKLKFIEEEKNLHLSGIAIHPFEKDKFYLISGVEKLLIIMNKDGLLLETAKAKIKERLYPSDK